MRYFDISEFDCPCCKRNLMAPAFLNMLDNARHIAGVPFHINSGWRCVKHNHEIGGSGTSSHLIGLAADIKCANSNHRFQIITSLLKVGFKRIGVDGDFIHVDNDLLKDQEIIWTY